MALFDMAKGPSKQATHQFGEYLVASELDRIGLVACCRKTWLRRCKSVASDFGRRVSVPFSRNVPDCDIIATDSTFHSVPVRVKASNGTSWHFDNRDFVHVRRNGKRQVLGPPVPIQDNIVCVFVALSRDNDRFYVLSLKAFQKWVITGCRKMLKRYGGVRPKNSASTHGAIKENDLAPFKDAWISEFRDKQGLSIIDHSV